MKREIDFATEDGTRLNAFFHPAEIGRPAPLITMAHGFSGVKERIDHYAAAFAMGGFCVLLHDHRGFGRSDGKQRQEVDPAVQISDWRDAITFGLTLPEVDPAAGVGIWGSSFSSGLSIVLAAVDARIACVVAQIPNVSGHRNGPRLFDAETLERLRKRAVEDRANRLRGSPPEMIPVYTTEQGGPCALPPAVDPGFIEDGKTKAPTWKNEVTLRSVEHLLTFEPAGWMPYVAPKPFMMIVGRQDICAFVEVQLEVFEEAREPKRLVMHPGGHFDTYSDHFEQTSSAACEWFQQHLPAPGIPSGPAGSAQISTTEVTR